MKNQGNIYCTVLVTSFLVFFGVFFGGFFFLVHKSGGDGVWATVTTDEQTMGGRGQRESEYGWTSSLPTNPRFSLRQSDWLFCGA